MNLTDSQKHYIRSSFASMQDKDDLLLLLNKAKEFLYGENNTKKIKEIALQSLTYYANTTLDIPRYKTFKVRKKNGKERIISAPLRNLKLILRCLNLVLQCVFEKEMKQKEKFKGKYVMGFVSNRGIRENAVLHTNKNYVYNLDLQDFFHQIELHRVKACLKLPPFKLDKQREPLAFLIANLCCEKIQKEKINENGEKIQIQNAVLPQGAPTSPVLSNIVCQQLDSRLNGLAKRFGCTYTRYADDITFSSQHNVYQEDSEFTKELNRIIKDQNFTINTEKTRLQKSGYKQEVTGLIVNEKVNVNQHYIKNLRTIIHNWEKMGKEDAEQIFRQNYKNDKGHIQKGTPSMQQVVEGKLNFLKMVRGGEDATYKKLWERFSKLKGNIKNKTKPNKSNSNEKGESKNLAHDPFKVVQILKYFSTDDVFKYATHYWEPNRFVNGYIGFIEELKEKWKNDKHVKNFPTLNIYLFSKIKTFLFHDFNNSEEDGWGEYYIPFGWSHYKLLKYVQRGGESFDYEFPVTFLEGKKEEIKRREGKSIRRFSDLIELFKNEIEFRDSRPLSEIIMSLASEYLPKSDYIVTFGDLGFSFYTDVQWAKKAIKTIFKSFTDRKDFNKIHIEAKKDANSESILLSFAQKYSYVKGKAPDDAKFRETGGTFNELRTQLNSLCNFWVEAKFKDEKYYRVYILHKDYKRGHYEELQDGHIEGFTYILQFYL